MDIVTLEEPTDAFRRSLLAGLDTLSDLRAGDRKWPAQDLCFAIRDAAGEMSGGLWGRFFYGWLYIDLIFVPADRRGQDLGSAVLAMAEADARALGCVGIWLDTFSFQARGFYEKHGFAVFGEIGAYPGPHRRFFLSKRLDPAGPLDATHPSDERLAEPAPHDREAISVPLESFNDTRIGGGPWPDALLGLALRDADGNIDGGLWGRSYYDWLYVDLLYVPEALRGQGIGAELLRRAEAEAKKRGCVGVWLNTFTFQAPDYYPRHGYVRLGEVADYPPPHRRVFFSKRL